MMESVAGVLWHVDRAMFWSKVLHKLDVDGSEDGSDREPCWVSSKFRLVISLTIWFLVCSTDVEEENGILKNLGSSKVVTLVTYDI